MIALFAGVTAASLATSACSSDDAAATRPASDDVAEYELFSNTIVLDAPKLAVQSETGGKLVFTSPPASLDSVHKGSVLVAGMGTSTPRGLLRYVKSATRQGDVLTLETADAPPQLAFRKLHVRATRTTPMIGNLKSGWPAPSVLSASLLLSPQVASPPGSIPLFDLGGVDFKKTLPFDFYPFDGDGDLKTTSDQVHAHAEFYGAFKFNVGIDVDWGAVEDLPSAALDCVGEWLTGGSCNPMDLLPEAVVRLDVDSGLGAKALLEGAAYREFKVPVEFPSIALDPIPIGILVFFPSVEFYGEASGKASSRFLIEASAGLQLAGSIESGTSGSLEVSGFEPKPTFDASTPTITLQANGKAEAGVKLELKLYDIAGAWAGLGAYARVEADQLATPCWKLHGGLEAKVGYVIELDAGPLGLLTLAEGHKDIPIVDEELTSGSCKLPEDGGPATPGSGPTNETMLHPSFTPWSRTYSGSEIIRPSTDAAGLRWAQLSQSIDGNWLLASSDGRALSKADSSGKLVWSKKYYRDDLSAPGDPPIRPVRVVPGDDATNLVVTHPFGVMKVGQAGGVAWVKSFDLPAASESGPYGDSNDQKKLTDAVSDGAGGMVVTGTYLPDGTGAGLTNGLVLRLDRDGSITQSMVLKDPSMHVYPTVIVASPLGSLVSGYLWTDAPKSRFTAFALLVKPDGTVAWSTAFQGCADAEDARPAAGLLSTKGDLVLTGSIGSFRRGFIARFAPDGSLNHASMPWTGSDLSYFSPSAIRELPTTGYLLAGRFTKDYDPEDTFLASIDVAGNPLWLQRYVIESSDPGLPAESSFPGIALTDDGGAMVLTHATWQGAGVGSLWLFKALARDGTLPFNPTKAGTVPYTLQTADACAITTSAWSPVVAKLAVSAAPRTVKVEAVGLKTDSQ